jgi:hypothetical protein
VHPRLRSLTRLAASALVVAILPVTAHAQHSAIGAVVVLGGTTGGVADPFVIKQIVVKDDGGTPVPNATVTLDFSNCTGADIRLCSDQPDPNIAVSCSNHAVTAITDGAGVARFDIVGYALNPGGGMFNAPAPGWGAGGVVVRANGVVLGTNVVAALDQNGQGGVTVVDLALFLNDRFSFNPGNGVATERGRSDYDGNQSINPVDLAILLAAHAAAGSTQSCGTVCP